MKWTSLGYREQEKLRSEYDKRHVSQVPEKPGDLSPPEQHERKTINTGYNSDLYVRMETGRHRQHDEASAQLRLVGSSEHVEVSLPVEAIPALIEQLQALHADMQAFNEAAEAHRAAMKAYEEAYEAYETKRDKALQRALKDGKFTQEDIVTGTGKIPF